jgi:hypothetical protein
MNILHEVTQHLDSHRIAIWVPVSFKIKIESKAIKTHYITKSYNNAVVQDHIKNAKFYMSIFHFLGGYTEKSSLQFSSGKK